MATLEERIRALEAEIEGYKAKLDAATTEAREKMYADLITAIRQDITALRQLQLQQQQGQAGGGGQGQGQENISVVMREEDVEKLARRLKAQDAQLSLYSDSELAKIVETQQCVSVNSINADDRESCVLDLKLKSGNEHELIVSLTPTLNTLCQDVNLLFVNSEECKWMHTILEHPDNYLKPDGLSCQNGLYVSKESHRSSLNDLREEYQTPYLFGHGIWEIRDMYKIWEFKIKIAPADRGTAYSYALHLSRDDALNTYHVILGDNTCFYIVEARGGVITKVMHGAWVNQSARRELLDTLRWQNPWERLLTEFCALHSVTVAGYLGRGACGRCFKVTTPEGSEKAMKIVLTLNDDGYRKRSCTISEFECLLQLAETNENVVKVEAESLRYVECDGYELGLGYMMSDIGTPISREICRQSNRLFELMTSLNTLHRQGYHHGDPRFKNAILVSDRLVWIDFMGCNLVPDISLMRADLKLLIKSIFGEVKDAALLGAIEDYDATRDKVVAIYNVLRVIHSL